MKTFLPNENDIERKWHLVDASNIPLGRLATRVALLLSGKRKPYYTYHIDTGDFVVVVNAARVKLTGRKFEDKKYYSHSTYPGGLKVRTFKQMIEKHPDWVIKLAVKRMLPKNKLGTRMLKRLKVYAGSEHKNQAQKPNKIDILTIN